jgi:hypothetical protein
MHPPVRPRAGVRYPDPPDDHDWMPDVWGDPDRGTSRTTEGGTMATVLFIIAAILVIAGIVTIIRGSLLFGIILIVVGLLVGPGGVSIFT